MIDQTDNLEGQPQNPVDYHVHNGVDAPQIDYNDLKNAPASGTGSKIRVHQSANGGSTGDFQISFDTVDFDINSEWDVTTKSFTAKTAGYYACYLQLAYAAAINTNFFYESKILKNNVVDAEAYQICVSGNPMYVTVACIISLAVSDVVTFHGQTNSGGAPTIDKGASESFATIFKIS